MTLAHLIIGERTWLAPAAVACLAALVLVWLAYRGLRTPRRTAVAAALLKAAALLLLVAFLIEPLWSRLRARPGANLVLIVADDSQSLTVHDDNDAKSRADQIRGVLTDVEQNTLRSRAAWQVRLEQEFDVRRYRFADGLQRTDDFSELKFSGGHSALRSTLHTLRERFRGRPVAGIILLTDGNATDLVDDPFDTSGLPPIFPVHVGEASVGRDLAITNVAVSRTAFEDAPVTVRVDAGAQGFTGRTVTARVIDEYGREAAALEQTIADDGPLVFRFQLRPTGSGLAFYTVRLTAAKPDDERSTSPGEATLANNARELAIDRGAGRRRILYVAGRPNWEYKFLHRALEDDLEVELAALIRIARKEAKFDFRGRAGESSNPLFRGFQADAGADTEGFDEPVIVRMGMRDAAELRSGFPRSEAELFRFHGVVLDDIEAGFFTPDQLDLLERFVSQRGGGLLMLGGQESFCAGGYEHTPVGRMLPVYLNRAGGDESHGPYQLDLTRDGWLQPWVRLRSSEAEERRRVEAMPEFKTLNPAEGIKPGATVLARAGDVAGRALPALVVQNYGRGRSAAFTVGDLWRWRLRQEDDADDHGKACRQLLRWLVADVPEPVDIDVQPDDELAAGAVRLRVRARDEKFGPRDQAGVTLSIQPAGDEALTLSAEPSLDEPGLYEAAYVARQPGPYRITATVTDSEGRAAGLAEGGWVHDPSAEEFRSIGVDEELLARLAEKTGGRILRPDELDDFAARLPAQAVPVTAVRTWPLWHEWWVFALVAVCLAGEWGLRRWNGLA